MSERFYGDLAPWWPWLSPASEYADEATGVLQHLQRCRRPLNQVLELGSGGGHMAVHLKDHVQLTLSDLSAQMLAVSQQLNPALPHHQGDMRTLRLDQRFDAVFVHDAVDYMRTPRDLDQLMATARHHLRPNGLLLLLPDHVAERFAPSTDHGGSDAEGRSARYLEWSWRTAEGVCTHYSFVLRDAQGVHCAQEAHHTGLFTTQAWLDALERGGFEAEHHVEQDVDWTPRTAFLGTLRGE